MKTVSAKVYAKREYLAGRFPDIGVVRLPSTAQWYLIDREGHILADRSSPAQYAALKRRKEARERKALPLQFKPECK